MATRKIEFGDFQTPLELSHAVTNLLVEQGVAPETIIEPTCGQGGFIVAARNALNRIDFMRLAERMNKGTEARVVLGEPHECTAGQPCLVFERSERYSVVSARGFDE